MLETATAQRNCLPISRAPHDRRRVAPYRTSLALACADLVAIDLGREPIGPGAMVSLSPRHLPRVLHHRARNFGLRRAPSHARRNERHNPIRYCLSPLDYAMPDVAGRDS